MHAGVCVCVSAQVYTCVHAYAYRILGFAAYGPFYELPELRKKYWRRIGYPARETTLKCRKQFLPVFFLWLLMIVYTFAIEVKAPIPGHVLHRGRIYCF